LSTMAEGLRATRRLEVRKLRGSSYRPGTHFYDITPGGIVVYPRVWPLRGSPLLDGARELVEAGSRRARAGVEVYGVREHQASEFLRHIHWRSTARRGRPVGLEFERGGPGPVLLLLDLRPGGDDEALEELIRAAASLAAVAVRDGHRVAVAGSRGDGVVREGGGWWPLLEWLARATPEAGLEAPEVVRRLLPGAPPGESLVVLSRTPGAAAAALGLWGGAGGAVLAGVAAADAGAVRARGVRVAHLRAGAAPAEALQNSEAGGAAWT
ncbi:MAG: DUF58 domain-containing protein, partial [Armatimonadetes bacterium]|nr:DUF58 domain-containing protein [Armatimonadota bacterium]